MALSIQIVSIGKTQHSAWQALEAEYARRITAPWRLNRTYHKTETALCQWLDQQRDDVVLLDEHGPMVTSVQFTDRLRTHEVQSLPIIFVVGDAAGFSDRIRNRRHSVLALSPMTFPHEAARVLLLEQLYRAQTIVTGHPYHK
jgi:23S rRNA (pseudouridine1915-N3)-methyltransferase